MKTEIYKSYAAFLSRENKQLNGVSQSFADANPGWDEERGNEGCWNCARCSRCARCVGCVGCADCARCADCDRCACCSRCADCADCADLEGDRAVEGQLLVPVIQNIHARVAEAVKQPNALDMSTWHTCNTTHCRAGWVTTLAGEAGKKLEEQTSTEFAAMQIYKASSPIRVSPVRFYENNEKALADIERCAVEEAEIQSK